MIRSHFMEENKYTKNIAVIFAGGTGRRMCVASKPKQFLELSGKPVIIYTLELFDNHPLIDGIVVACLEDWIPYLEKQMRKFEINKVARVVAGGDTSQESIYNALSAAVEVYGLDCNVLIHDGVRPLITAQTISDNIETVKAKGNCITCVPATETVVVNRADSRPYIPSRPDTIMARAPQSFRLDEILNLHERARAEGRHDFIDCCSMMSHYGHEIHTIMGPMENIKITTPTDFFIFRAMVEVHENQQIFGF